MGRRRQAPPGTSSLSPSPLGAASLGTAPLKTVPLCHEDILARLDASLCGPVPCSPFTGVRRDDRGGDGDLFVAVRGAHYDGHAQLARLPARHPEAPLWGVRGVVGEQDLPFPLAFPYYRVASSRRALALLEQGFHGDPARSLRVVGITGTNGKSTSVRLLAAILEAAGRHVGWNGTVTSRLGGDERPSSMTTPEPHELAGGMADLVAAGGQDLVLEVSSHALVQERVAGIAFAGALLTNLSHDHLDFHGTREAYLKAKLELFRSLADGAPAVVPRDGPVARDHEALHHTRPLTFAESGPADAYPLAQRFAADGTVTRLRILSEEVDVRSPLVGRHNLRNILATALLARGLGVPLDAVARGIAASPPVAGRLQRVAGGPGRIYVDYAHTPDALQGVLEAARELTPGRLLVVFGCGGDRDRGKRPEMGRVASTLADRVFVTSDNPRFEDPQRIIEEVLIGVERGRDVEAEPDRAIAIGRAVAAVEAGDVLVVAGKGHEREQLVSGRSLPFDDRHVIQAALGKRCGS